MTISKLVMYRIGDLWAQKKLDVATEHVCSNAARSLINAINSGIAKRDHRGKVIICTSTGELHNLGCGIIESVLLSKGYQVFNISPLAPIKSVTNYIKDLNPLAILISLTLQDNFRMGQSLVRRIRTISSGLVIVGGQAINEMMESKFEATIMRGPSLDEIITLVTSNQVN